ncbi:hypothetical protein PVAND_009826 [Polypedilum vanderplanki]|uniref:Copper transport protein n=1 Tax=Polypedilum vanderplanki TaxID=319348 RepID=A0A9J6CDQ9_POLVA|nr:hypothetical protein PVAND_009826 [Polypedilum vanderplanki]
MHMHMNFWWGTDVGDFFIKGFTINGATAVTALCVVLFLLSVLSEALKVHRASSRSKAAREQRRSVNSENTTLLSANGNNRQPLLTEIIKGLKDVSIFAFHNILSYGLMLAVMMYNGYFFIAVALGSFVGHLLFGHKSMKINMENLQAIHTKIVCSTRCADSEEPCTSGTTPIISHCPTIVGESSQSGVTVMQQRMQKSNSEDSNDSETSIINEKNNECHT